MKYSRRAAMQAEENARLRAEKRELEAEIKAMEIELAAKERALSLAERENGRLRESCEHLMKESAERTEALAEAERQYQAAAQEAREFLGRMKTEAAAQIAAMRRENMVLRQ